jgi:D-3-phosphoglycerate dehydrogenase
MRKPEVLLAGPFSTEETQALEQDYIVHKPWEAPDADAFFAGLGPDVRAIVTAGNLGASAALMGRLPHLEIVACYGVGFDAIDLDYARAHGVRVTNTPDVLTEDVADMGMALLLATARRIPFGDRWVREGRWPRGPMPLTTSLSGKRLGILGLGRIGRAVAHRASAFGMKILYTGRAPHADMPYDWRDDVVALAQDSDFLIVCAAGGAETRAVVNGPVLDALGPEGFLINVSRGSLIDEPALIAALREGRIAGAGLDVYLDEPNIDPAFLTLDTVVLQPHNGSGTRETRRAIGKLMRANLAAHFAGQPLPTPVI